MGAREGTEGRPVGESGVPTLVVSVLMIRFQLCSSGCFYQNQCAKYEQICQWGRFEEVREAGVKRGPTGQPAGGGGTLANVVTGSSLGVLTALSLIFG